MNNGNQTQPIKCTQCGADYRVHPAAFSNVMTPFSSLYCLGASWSIDERACPQCRTIHVPALRIATVNGQIVVDWIAFGQQPEPKRIVVPSVIAPGNLRG